MVKSVPTHLFNQEITLISGGLSYDEYGEETYSERVVSSGSGRLEYEDLRLLEDGNVIFATAVRAFTAPTVSGAIGQLVDVSGQKFRIQTVNKMVDGKGIERYRVLGLIEVSE